MHTFQCSRHCLSAHGLTITVENIMARPDSVFTRVLFHCPGEPDQTHRFIRRAASRPGTTGGALGVHGFKGLPAFGGDLGDQGSGVQSSILVPRLHLGCIFTTKASASSGVSHNLEPNWQLLGKMSLFNEASGSSMPSLSLTLNR